MTQAVRSSWKIAKAGAMKTGAKRARRLLQPSPFERGFQWTVELLRAVGADGVAVSRLPPRADCFTQLGLGVTIKPTGSTRRGQRSREVTGGFV